MNKFLNILAKTVFGLLLVAICATALAYYAVQLPEVQTTLTQKGTKWLSEKLGGKVTVSNVKISWLDEITFEDVNIKDLEGRDMIFVRELYVNCKTNFTFDTKNFIQFNNNIDYVLLKNPEVKLVREKTGQLNIDDWISSIEKLTNDTTQKSVGNNNKAFTIDNAYIKNGFVSVRDARKALLPEQSFDYYNFAFEQVNASLEKVLLLGDTVAFKTTALNAVDKRSKLQIKDIKTDFLYCKSAMLLDNLDAKINNSYVGNSLHFYYERPSAFNNFFEKVEMQANLKNTVLDAQDLGRFSPNMYAFNEKYLLTTKMKGRYVDLTFNEFDLKFGQKTSLTGTVNFKGFPNLKTTKTNLNLKSSLIDASDIKQYSYNAEYQKYLSKIEQVTASGTYNGFYNNFVSNAIIDTKGLGKAKGIINMIIADNSDNSSYFGDLDITELNLGKLIEDDKALQKISFKGKIKGKGLNVAKATLELDGQIASIGFKEYNYQNIRVDGKLGQSIFDGYIDINDPSVKAEVSGKVDFSQELNNFNVKGNVFTANLKKLGLSETEMTIKSKINFDFIGNKIDDWVGRAQFLDTQIEDKNKVLAIDSMFLNSAITNNQRRFSIISEFFNFYVNGDFVPSNLIKDVDLMVKEYKQYFYETEQTRIDYYKSKKITNAVNDYNANYRLFFKDSERFFKFFEPNFYVSSGSALQGKFVVSNKTEFSAVGTLDTLTYKGNSFYTNDIDFNSSKSTFNPEVLSNLVINSKNQKIAGDVETQDLKINAQWQKADIINFNAAIDQSNTNSNAKVFGNILFQPSGFDVSFDPKVSNLVLIDNKWEFSENNLINVVKDKILVKNLKLTNKDQSVSLNGIVSTDPNQESILTVQDFNLNTLKAFTNTEIKGTANGELRLRDFYKNPFYTSNLFIDELIYRNSLIGTVSTEAIWDNVANKLNINGNVYRINKEIFRVNGTFDPKNQKSPLALKAKLRNANIQMFEGMLGGTFSNMGGLAEGDVVITGKPESPIFKGEVDIVKGTLKVNSSGTTLYFDDKIIINETGFVAAPAGITVRDAPLGGNSAEIKGGIYNLGNNRFSVGLDAFIKGKEGFKIMNLKSTDNEVFYGTAFASGDLHISGDFANINIDANLSSKKGTKITIPLDGGKKIDVRQQGIPFISKKNKIDSITNLANLPKVVKNGGVKMAFNVSLTPDAECEIIFDRLNNDVLDVFGDGRLSINYDTRGEFTISGPYVVRSGKYNFSFQNLASLRKFDIVDGSRITWSGDPYDATLDLKATYKPKISIAKITKLAADANARYPVNVNVFLTDRLLTPTIKYDLSFDPKLIPIASQTYLLSFEQTLRNDEQLMSRNVSSLLVFNEIFPDNFVDALTQQFLIDNVSNILSNQIGNLANKLNPNLELGVQFGDFRDNILNNMQLNFSYRFLNNRMKLSGNSSFINTLETNINANTTGQLSVGGEIEYLLSPDGEYKFKLFSKSVPPNYYFFSTTGNVMVSGGNFIISRNFNSFLNNKKSKSFPIGIGQDKKEEPAVILETKNTIQ